MINKEISQSRYGRKLLQTNSSSFDTSQPSFIALLCIISILTLAFVISVIVLCYRYYSHREEKLNKKRYKHRRRHQEDNNQQSNEPVSLTPTTASSYSVRSSEQLFSTQQRQTPSINTIPSCRLQQSILDAYLNDINSYQPTTLDAQQLNSYLFIDLHSTSSETFPNRTLTSGYSTSTEDDIQRKHRNHLKRQKQARSTLTSKRISNSRFLVRERSLPTNLSQLPQLRPITNRKQNHLLSLNDTDNSSTTIINQDLQSTTTTTDDYDDSHAYRVHQNQIMHTIKEENSFNIQPDQQPYFFEIVSTNRDDYSEIQIPNRLTYIDDSIIV